MSHRTWLSSLDTGTRAAPSAAPGLCRGSFPRKVYYRLGTSTQQSTRSCSVYSGQKKCHKEVSYSLRQGPNTQVIQCGCGTGLCEGTGSTSETQLPQLMCRFQAV